MLSILLGFLGYSILNISQATQKIGLRVAKEKKLKGWSLWIAATLGTSVSIFIVYAAVSLGWTSLIGAITPTGLVSLAVFSYFVMKEKLGKKEVAGIVIILCGAGIIAALSRADVQSVIRLDRLFLMLGIVCLSYLVAIIVFIKKNSIAGIIIGGFAGALGGFIPLFQKVSSSEIGRASNFFSEDFLKNIAPFWSFIFTYIANLYSVIWIVISLISVLVLQFSYKRDQAIRIIPSFSANATIMPIIGGVICFSEQLHVLQWPGVVLILGGLFLLTVKLQSKHNQIR